MTYKHLTHVIPCSETRRIILVITLFRCRLPIALGTMATNLVTARHSLGSVGRWDPVNLTQKLFHPTNLPAYTLIIIEQLDQASEDGDREDMDTNPADNYVEVFLSHAEIYCFDYGTDWVLLCALLLYRLPHSLASFVLLEEWTGDIVRLLRFAFVENNTWRVIFEIRYTATPFQPHFNTYPSLRCKNCIFIILPTHELLYFFLFFEKLVDNGTSFQCSKCYHSCPVNWDHRTNMWRISQQCHKHEAGYSALSRENHCPCPSSSVS